MHPPKDFNVPKNCNVLWFQFISVVEELRGKLWKQQQLLLSMMLFLSLNGAKRIF
jgi:hypothetical protein